MCDIYGAGYYEALGFQPWRVANRVESLSLLQAHIGPYTTFILLRFPPWSHTAKATQGCNPRAVLPMALPLFILPCIHHPPGDFHSPPYARPLRIQIEGPLTSMKRLLPDVPWRLRMGYSEFPQPAGPELARWTFQQLYGRDISQESPDELVVRDEYLGWVIKEPPYTCVTE